jgi:PHP family Zn ribbon phosphoesterase
VKIKADLHMHSCLSPCGDLDMSPGAIALRARELGLDLICVTDHNTALNSRYAARACQNAGLRCLYGIEIMTQEEVHVLCYFDDLPRIMELDRFVAAHLPDTKNDIAIFGDQAIVDEQDNVLGQYEKILGNAVAVSLERLRDLVLELGGLFVPAHVNRPRNSLISQLGFILPGEKYSAVEVHKSVYLRGAAMPDTQGYPVLSNSDAHYLEDIGLVYNEIEAEDFSLAALKEALEKKAVVVKTRAI